MPNPEQKPTLPKEELLRSEVFDFDSFFGGEKTHTDSNSSEPFSEGNIEKMTLLSELQANSTQAVEEILSTINSTTFEAGASMANNVLAGIQTLIGSCSAVCMHSLAQAGNLSQSSLGINTTFFNSNETKGTTKNSLSPAFSNLFSGKTSSREMSKSLQDFFAIFSEVFGNTTHVFFGFGLIETLCHGFLPTPLRSAK